jgi:hypothetical protein
MEQVVHILPFLKFCFYDDKMWKVFWHHIHFCETLVWGRFLLF